MLLWSQAAFTFNRESYNLLKEVARETDGFKIILSESSSQVNLSIIKKAILYSDLIVVYSGSSSYVDFSKVFIDGLKKAAS